MARPKSYPADRIQMQVRLAPKLYDRLEKEAARRVVSKTFLVERALTQALEEWEDEQTLASSY